MKKLLCTDLHSFTLIKTVRVQHILSKGEHLTQRKKRKLMTFEKHLSDYYLTFSCIKSFIQIPQGHTYDRINRAQLRSLKECRLPISHIVFII
jgi:hypothetical protein